MPEPTKAQILDRRIAEIDQQIRMSQAAAQVCFDQCCFSMAADEMAEVERLRVERQVLAEAREGRDG